MRLEYHVLSSALHCCRSCAGDGRQSNLPSAVELSNRLFSTIALFVMRDESMKALTLLFPGQVIQGQSRCNRVLIMKG